MNHLNATSFTPENRDLRYRAEVASDGSVALIADTEQFTATVDNYLEDRSVTVIELSQDEYLGLHSMCSRPDMALSYNHDKHKFSAKSIG